MVYDNGLFLYSHHATDPCSGRLVNAFDLVRLHTFGELDYTVDPKTTPNRLPAYQAMCELAASDVQVSKQIAFEHFRNNWPFDVVVLDESSSFKNLQSKRFKSLKIIRSRIKRFIELTGTPASNGFEYLWAQIYLLDGGAREFVYVQSVISDYRKEVK